MHIFPFVAFSVLFFVFYCLNYCVFSVALQDDVEFCKGKKRVKSRKKQKGFWKKFLFLDIRKEVILWHYLLGESGRICNGLCGNARLFHT